MTFDLSGKRNVYGKDSLNESSLPSNPFILLTKWLDEAVKSKIPEPGAMILSTVDENAKPSSRVVLLKKLENKKLFFYTNYDSKKSKHILRNNNISLLFFWPEMERQVRIEGQAFKVTKKQSDEYFAKRPKQSQIGAWASPQSSVISSMDDIKRNIIDLEKKFSDQSVPRPDSWGGFYISPVHFEFWQGRPGRLNDRIVFKLQNKHWNYCRLAP